jgi:hypothetical protein
MRSSSDWVQTPQGQWMRAHLSQTRGLTRTCSRTLEQVFKGAATTVVMQHPDDPLHKDCERLLAGGTKPNLAKLMLARKLAAMALAMWKHKEAHDETEPSTLQAPPRFAECRVETSES